MITHLKITWFKCFEDFEISFKNQITLLVWENDAWKSSLLTVIRILKWELSVDQDDFRNSEIPIVFEIEVDSRKFKFTKEFSWNEILSEVLNIAELKDALDKGALSSDEINVHIKTLWWDLRGADKGSKLRTLLNAISECKKEIWDIPKNNLFSALKTVKFEDGKQFSDIQQNFKNFIKDDVNKIWEEEFAIAHPSGNTENKKLSDLVAIKLKEIKNRKETEYRNNLLPVIQGIIPSVAAMNLDLNPNLWNFSSYESRVDFLQGGKSINIDKKWDGTKRRITLAIFQEESLRDRETSNTYLFDEPDTHLNLRAQQDLVNTFSQLKEKWHQVIFTSHSPFILNLIDLQDVVLLQNNGDKSEKIEMSIDDSESFNTTLYKLWIQNIDIFFAKSFIFYEGETELQFFSHAFYKKFWFSIEKKFIRQIDCGWIDNEAIFLKNFCSIVWKWIRITSVVDKDYSTKTRTKNIIDWLKAEFSDFKLIELWTDKEFEDEFSCEQLYECFVSEFNASEINSVEELKALKETIPKFSWILSFKTWFSKPEIWLKLAQYYEFEQFSVQIQDVLTGINSL